MTLRAGVAFACCLSVLLTESSQAQALLDDIEGRWEGFVTVTDNHVDSNLAEQPIAAGFQLRVVISPEGMRVIVNGSNTWGFSGGHVMRADPSAVVSSATGADDRADSWTLTVTQRDENTLLAFVSVFAIPESSESQMPDYSAVAATGILNRIRDD